MFLQNILLFRFQPYKWNFNFYVLHSTLLYRFVALLQLEMWLTIYINLKTNFQIQNQPIYADNLNFDLSAFVRSLFIK